MNTKGHAASVSSHLPNCITMLRIVGTACLLFVEPFTAAFYWIYTLSGFSDILDGWIARRLKITSDLGARLDSIADLMFYTVMGVRIFPVLWSTLPRPIWLEVIGTILVRLCAYAVAAVKYRRFASQHTYMNKLTGAVIFTLPYVIKTSAATPICVGIGVIAGLASLEELIIHIVSREYDPNRKTIFYISQHT